MGRISKISFLLSFLIGLVNGLNAYDADDSSSGVEIILTGDIASQETESQSEEEEGRDIELVNASYDLLSLIRRGQDNILSDIKGTMSPETLERRKEAVKEIAQKRGLLKQEVTRIAGDLKLTPFLLSRQLFETYYTSSIQRDVIEAYLNWKRPKRVRFLHNDGTFDGSSPQGDFYFDLSTSAANPPPRPVYWGEKDTSYFLHVFGDMPIDRWQARIKMMRRESPLESGDLPEHSYVLGMKSGNRALFERGHKFFMKMKIYVEADKNNHFRLLFGS